jgi:DNA replication protein DnaC
MEKVSRPHKTFCRRYLPFETNAAHLLFQLASRRYERSSLLLTIIRIIGEWGVVS